MEKNIYTIGEGIIQISEKGGKTGLSIFRVRDQEQA